MVALVRICARCLVLLSLLCVASANPPSIGAWLTDGTFFNATDVLHVFGGIDRSTESGAASVLPLQAPLGGSYSLTEKRSLLGSMDLLPTPDGGDVACQGSLNTMEIVVLVDHAKADALALAKQWLTSVPLDSDGRVWDSSNQQYHQKKQGAWESAAEWILMARLYAAHSGDLAVFATSIDRLLCTEDAGTGVVRASGATANASLCTTAPSQIADRSAELGLGDMYRAATTVPPFTTRDKPRLQVAATKRLIQRFATGAHAVGALLLPIGVNQGNAQHHYPAALCVKDVATGDVVYRAALNMSTRNVTAGGWTRVALRVPLPAHSTFDVAITNAVVPAHHSGEKADCATWLTRTAVAGGAGRIGTWGYVHAGMNASGDDNSCCVQEWSPPGNGRSTSAALAPTLASRLEEGMIWQLGLADATPSTPPNATARRFGVLIVPDAFHNGVPVTGMATCGASSMWDQIRMGWKSMYINALFLASLDAWIELENAGVVRSLATLVGAPAGAVRAQVAGDIEAQFGYDTDEGEGGGRGFLSWISCNATSADGAFSTCPRGQPSGGGQRAFDTQMMPDQAWAVKLGLPKARVRLDAMLVLARSDGLVRNNLVPQESIDPRIVSSADKWDPVTKEHYCDPMANGSMAYAGHCVCATDASSRLPNGTGAGCYGNFKMNQQNGGKVFATQTTVFEAGPYLGSLDDFRTNVKNLRAVVAQLRSAHPAATPLLGADRGYVRSRIPGGGALRAMCLIENHGALKKNDANGSTLEKDAWGEDLCNYNKDTTFGLRTGPRGVLIGFAVGHLGLRVGVNGTLLLHRQPVAADAATMDVGLPDEVAKRWPAELKGVRLGGVRVGARRADVACNVTSFTTPGALALRCEFEWGTPSSPMH